MPAKCLSARSPVACPHWSLIDLKWSRSHISTAEQPSEFDPRKFFAQTIVAMRDICIARYEAFGTAGNASKIKPISLEGMYQRYAKGELNAKVN